MSTFVARLRGLDPRLLDSLLAGALVVLCIGEVIAFSDGDGTAIVTGILGVPILATMYWRRTLPLLPAVALASYFVITGGLAPDYFNRLSSPFVGLMIMLFSLGRYARIARRPSARSR